MTCGRFIPPTAVSCLPLIHHQQIVNDNVTADDQKHRPVSYRPAVDFIHRHRQQPLVLYVPYSMPHALFVSESFAG